MVRTLQHCQQLSAAIKSRVSLLDHALFTGHGYAGPQFVGCLELTGSGDVPGDGRMYCS